MSQPPQWPPPGHMGHHPGHAPLRPASWGRASPVPFRPASPYCPSPPPMRLPPSPASFHPGFGSVARSPAPMFGCPSPRPFIPCPRPRWPVGAGPVPMPLGPRPFRLPPQQQSPVHCQSPADYCYPQTHPMMGSPYSVPQEYVGVPPEYVGVPLEPPPLQYAADYYEADNSTAEAIASQSQDYVDEKLAEYQATIHQLQSKYKTRI
ncbi:Hypothetical predicted protein [Cloeon dipterum]|uniref:Uncharacterized protein n=1 Tax=Cloeon dipterum TaxID=197152 RepID=A0A8S1CVQ5_9INSE|nr:Hypothetical predicted protein [Cloeon dipterum]